MQESKRISSWFVFFIYASILGVVAYFASRTVMTSAKTVSYSEFVQAARNGNLSKIEIGDTQFVGTFKPPANSNAEPSIMTTDRPAAMDESWLLQQLASNG